MTDLINRSDDILGGTPVFAGTRVPVQTLFDYLEEGDSLDEFLDAFPAVSREHAIKVREKMKETFLLQDYESTVGSCPCISSFHPAAFSFIIPAQFTLRNARRG